MFTGISGNFDWMRKLLRIGSQFPTHHSKQNMAAVVPNFKEKDVNLNTEKIGIELNEIRTFNQYTWRPITFDNTIGYFLTDAEFVTSFGIQESEKYPGTFTIGVNVEDDSIFHVIEESIKERIMDSDWLVFGFQKKPSLELLNFSFDSAIKKGKANKEGGNYPDSVYLKINTKGKGKELLCPIFELDENKKPFQIDSRDLGGSKIKLLFSADLRVTNGKMSKIIFTVHQILKTEKSSFVSKPYVSEYAFA